MEVNEPVTIQQMRDVADDVMERAIAKLHFPLDALPTRVVDKCADGILKDIQNGS